MCPHVSSSSFLALGNKLRTHELQHGEWNHASRKQRKVPAKHKGSIHMRGLQRSQERASIEAISFSPASFSYDRFIYVRTCSVGICEPQLLHREELQ